VIHRYAMLGVLDEEGYPLREMGVLAAAQNGSGTRDAPNCRPAALPGVRQRDADPQGRLRLLHRLRLRRAVRLSD
jgi:ribonucleoside-diphosphate reductase alpha chain